MDLLDKPVIHDLNEIEDKNLPKAYDLKGEINMLLNLYSSAE